MKILPTAGRAARRFVSSLPALFGVLVLTFLLMRVLPGDPAVFFASGPNSGKEEIETIRKQMGLDKPIPTQLVLYLRDVATGNLGRSLMTGQSVTKICAIACRPRWELTFLALLLALIFAIPLGVLAALRPGSLIDHSVRDVLRARRLRADLRVGPAVDLHLLLHAWHIARPNRPRRYFYHIAADANRVPADRLRFGPAISTAGWLRSNN